MHSTKSLLLSTTFAPLVVLAGVAIGGALIAEQVVAKPAYAACNPCAVKKLVGNPCNPCAVAACNPCAVKKICNPCNPCAAAKACNPCAAGGAAASLECAVPRLQTATLANPCNPCAAAKVCNPCNPCAAAKACNPCNPCAIKKVSNPCNPCAAAKVCNPCNPCAAAKVCNPCNPCAAAKVCNPCNPCAAAKVCNPCAVKKVSNPCNPCAAANPCNPCAAANACNPCGAGDGIQLTSAEAVSTYDCLLKGMKAAYAKSDDKAAISYSSWRRYSTRAYTSETHGNRYVQNYANDAAKAYGAFEKAGTFPAGALMAKDSFSVKADGAVAPGPLFLMEKMAAGFNPDSDNWRYTMIMPTGQIFGTTKGAGGQKVEFCVGCHMSVTPEMDSTMLLPEEYRVR